MQGFRIIQMSKTFGIIAANDELHPNSMSGL